ncbi:MAG: hypothetical protein HY696_06330 [Deltaproteobacteria bacterium]|nr:hypothetical protein [Deltaproteobacteria bacterium]
MTEALTGRSVMSGERLHAPEPDLGRAHDRALLQDPTKDVPLRTSEAFLLDVLAADARQPGRAAILDRSLEVLWATPHELPVDALPNATLQRDTQRRLALIDQLRERLQQWHPADRAVLQHSGLAEIAALRQRAHDQIVTIEKEIGELSEQITKQLAVPLAHYRLALRASGTAADRERLTFEMLMDFRSASVFARLSAEDPTLASYERYLNYEASATQRVMKWAELHPELYSPTQREPLQRLREQRHAASDARSTLEVWEGQLRRLEIQMRVAVGVRWLSAYGPPSAVQDFTVFVTCESSAVLTTP